jgi:hypothetical protein
MAACVCPRCGEESAFIKSRRMDIVSTSDNRPERCIVFQCPKCNAVLGCQLDPSAMKDAIVREVVAAIRTEGA